MGRYWSGRIRMLLLVGLPCILCSLALGSMPRNITAVKLHIDRCSKEERKFGACVFDEAASTDFKIWVGVNMTLILFVLYYGVTHSISWFQCLKEHGCCDCDSCDCCCYCDCDCDCDCCESFDCYDACTDGCQDLDGFVYFYLMSIGLGYCALVDLICYFAMPFLVTVVSLGKWYRSSMSPVVFVLGQYSGYASLCMGVAWILTLTVCLPCVTSRNKCVRSLAPVLGTSLSFGLIFVIIAASSQKTMEKLKVAHHFEKYQLMTSGLILAFTNVVCYLLTYLIELRRKHIQESNEQFYDLDDEYTPQSSFSNVTQSGSYAYELTRSPAEVTDPYDGSTLTVSRAQLSTFV
ncbi:hypothetical protein GL50803_003269 [Giardia duodenalis]|uniref:Uncharacterized protein n=1 Tax=Giardia intestinalis (strain ATCC 50803 / WB clone C6) TaxID=184922 RepID=A8BWB9_GIAIC|nr:hypothetical protein GL50803_003269 [Giardia intestinalis]KAE8306021.1 hypothetical protein GL50803_003269 [Giardia intestinalis]|eukprot:XP_001704474.1 Hypothetical protein GL50803_3269 [Giardia lamblia ATCC 50803]